MTKQWIEEKRKEYQDELKILSEQIRNFIKECPIIENMWANVIYAKMDRAEDIYDKHSWSIVYDLKTDLVLSSHMYLQYRMDSRKITPEIIAEWENKKKETTNIDRYINIINELEKLSRYEDSKPISFDGDIVITDPCYMMKKKDDAAYLKDIPKKSEFLTHENIRDYEDAEEIFDDFWISKTQEVEMNKWEDAVSDYEVMNDDWATCRYGSRLDIIGIEKFMTRDTIYGDWGCTVSKIDDNDNIIEDIGSFCADAGLVTVADLSQVISYNPNFLEWANEHTWCATIIKDFKGTVKFEIGEEVYMEDDVENKFYSVHVVGEGIIKSTGEPIRFISYQGEL